MMDFKEEGNRFFQARKFNDAVQCYTKAIIKNPSMPTYFTNRALCYLKLKNWEKTCLDCKSALELDGNLVKGHFFQGQALLEMKLYDEAIACLTRAQALAKEQKLNFGDDITAAIRLARKRKFHSLEDKRIQQEIELQTYLNSLIAKECQKNILDINSANLNEQDKQEHRNNIEETTRLRLEKINELFAQVDDRRRRREVPDYLCGKISFEVMRDPVITPSGVTYDRKDIEEHLQRVGHFDPVTRTDLTQEQLIPNLALKEVIDGFLEENPWAEDF
ncbi:DgyrCDS6674 [Dimorphilus gyrociliatus]|uniref:E3 ubiquitin-protein ligase CHIP n=1 Tax=Dimorphilus gyrociliatus TaxID=2664684 RepID=A0A7I8VNS1_9ANNE|nr:DgyrCDS6674 [Dimorphilus gyrociliatus]